MIPKICLHVTLGVPIVWLHFQVFNLKNISQGAISEPRNYVYSHLTTFQLIILIVKIVVDATTQLMFSLPEYNTHENEACVAPDGKTGECIRIKQCQPLLNLLQRHRPVLRVDADYLRKSQCGFANLEPKVCCPTGQSSNITPDSRNPSKLVFVSKWSRTIREILDETDLDNNFFSFLFAPC